jgi:hypothetical protein
MTSMVGPQGMSLRRSMRVAQRRLHRALGADYVARRTAGGHQGDNQLGLEARIKRVYAIEPDAVTFAAPGCTLPVLAKTLRRDILSALDAASISVPDRVENPGITRNGRAYVVTDNDGVDENYGETVFIPAGLR